MVHLAQEHLLLSERGLEGLLHALPLSDLAILLQAREGGHTEQGLFIDHECIGGTLPDQVGQHLLRTQVRRNSGDILEGQVDHPTAEWIANNGLGEQKPP